MADLDVCSEAVPSLDDDIEDANACPVDSVGEPPLSAIYRNYAKELADGIRGRFGDGPPDPDDVMQEAFRRVFERGDLASIKNPKAFLWRTARNLVLTSKTKDEQRSKYDFEVEQVLFPLRGDKSTPETVMIAREQLKAINDALRQMPQKRRAAFYLYRVEGLKLAQVGKRLGIGRTAVSKHIAKAETQIDALFLDNSEEWR